jgi:hypothetical protein
MLLELGAAVIVIIVGLIFCFRMMRHGLTSLEKDRDRYLKRIRAEEQQLEEDKKNISQSEHLYIARAGIADILRLAGNPPGFSIADEEFAILLQTPEGVWRIDLNMREHALRNTGRVLRGKARWRLSGFGMNEQFDRIGDMMACLNAQLRGENVQRTEFVRHSTR